MPEIHYPPGAIAGMYRIPRGPAGVVTQAIALLMVDPYMGEALIGRSNTFVLQSVSYTIQYEIVEVAGAQVVRVLSVE